MADWTGAIMTNKGRTLEAKVMAGKCKLELTKLKVGDGTTSDIESMTDLVSPKANIGISSITPSDTGVCDVEGIITNTDLEKGFYMRELGVFAADPDDGEILYAVMTDSHADYLQAKGSSTALSVGLHMQVIITNADDVTAVLDPEGLLLRQDLDSHDSSEKAHLNLLQVTTTANKPASMSDRGIWLEIKDGLKSILHRWNSTNKEYDTLHPETESSQVTDWHSGIMASLASKTLGTVVDAITTDSVLGRLMKMLLNASGVKYSIDTNGYVCLGSFFGGLIIQWGFADDGNRVFNYPLTMTRLLCVSYTGAYHIGYIKNQTGGSLSFDGYRADLSAVSSSDNVARYVLVLGVL